MPCESRRSTSAPEESQSPPTSFFGALFGVPHRVFEYGADRGREWRRLHQDEDSSEDRGRRCRRWRGRNSRDDGSRNDAPEDDGINRSGSGIGGGGGDGEDDDWVKWIAKELEKGGETAREVYEQWERFGDRREDSNDGMSSAGQDNGTSSTSSSSSSWLDFFAANHHPIRERQDLSASEARDGLVREVEKLNKDIQSYLENCPFVTGPLWRQAPSEHYPSGNIFEDDAFDYLACNTYSPLHLEQEHGFDPSWRGRFEDLLRAQRGQLLMTKEELDNAKGKTWTDWMKSLGPQLETSKTPRYCPWATQPAATKDSTETELDAYERLLGFEREPENVTDAVKRWHMQKQSSLEQDKASSSSGITLTVTSTVTSTDPDGTIKTKTLVKKHFSDGRKESTETVESRKAPIDCRPTTNEMTSPADEQPKESAARETERKSGWFWTN